MNHGDVQHYFPLKPVYVSESTVEVTRGPEKSVAQRLIHDANIQWEREYGHKLTDAIPRLCPQANLTRKKTKVEKEERVKKHKESIR